MPNPNFPFGLEPVSYMSGAPYNAAVRTYWVPPGNATPLFIGDPVIGVTNQSDGNGIQVVQIAGAGSGNLVLGSIRGITNNAGQRTVTLLQSDPVYLPAGVGRYVLVSDDPNLLYAFKDDGVGGGLPSGAAGRNVNLIAGAGSTIYGTSGWLVSSASLATTGSLQMRVIELLQRPDITVGPNGLWLGKINDGIHPWSQGVGTLMSTADLNAAKDDLKDEIIQELHLRAAEQHLEAAQRGNGGAEAQPAQPDYAQPAVN